MLKYILIYFIFINIVAFLITVCDKNAAKAKKHRTAEKALFLISILGGSISMFVTMNIIRHKTKHKRFMIGIPIIIFLQLAIILWLEYKLYF